LNILPPFEHQKKTSEFLVDHEHAIVTSDPGTGKTRSVADAYSQVKADGRMLVLAPLSILEVSWADDLRKFQPNLTFGLSVAGDRETAFKSGCDIVIINHDGVKWITDQLKKNPKFLAGFDTLCIDEFTAFKNKDSARSKACLALAKLFNRRWILSGTPNSNTILDVWHPTLICDGGVRLGTRFYSFRQNVCTSRHNGFGMEWKDKADATDIVAAALNDISIRYALEECITMPERVLTTRRVKLAPKVRAMYKSLMDDAVIYANQQVALNVVHASAKIKKILQLCTGAVYDSAGEVLDIHGDRYQYIMDLVAERKHSLVAFNWTHERDAMVKLAETMGITYGVIDGSVSATKRAEVVNAMQRGELQVIFAHPQSAGHGLTLTRATTTIWASPTYNAEHYKQFNGRTYRAGQRQRTEIIHIAAEDTLEEVVYDKLTTKMERMEDLLMTLKELHTMSQA
jgi:SNF2 family DNA or RNA helicase